MLSQYGTYLGHPRPLPFLPELTTQLRCPARRRSHFSLTPPQLVIIFVISSEEAVQLEDHRRKDSRGADGIYLKESLQDRPQGLDSALDIPAALDGVTIVLPTANMVAIPFVYTPSVVSRLTIGPGYTRPFRMKKHLRPVGLLLHGIAVATFSVQAPLILSEFQVLFACLKR